MALKTRPPRTTWFYPSPKSICSAEGPARWAFGAAGWPVAALFRPRSGACFQGRLRFFSLHTAQVVRRVVSPAATALGLFPRSTATTEEVGAPTRGASGCVSAVSLRVSKALAALALQLAFRVHVRFHRHSHAAEFGERSHFQHLRYSRHWYIEVTGGSAVLNGVLVATTGTQLRDSLDKNVQEFELLPDEALRHTSTQILYRKPHTAVLRDCEGVETHTLLSIEGPQCADSGSEPVGGWWDDHQILAL